MKVLQALTVFGTLLITGSGFLLAIANPSPTDYELYATDALSFYLKDRICPQATATLGGLVQSYCKTLVDTGKPQIKYIVANSTQRKNFLIFSIYTTNISLPEPVPSYEFQTIGIMQQFYTYTADRL
ncbi:MAG: DUF4359 domain-containing protein [Microcystaceae cyanobacterium]